MFSQILGPLLSNPAGIGALLKSPTLAAEVLPFARRMLESMATQPDVPPDVIETGRAFLDALEKWYAPTPATKPIAELAPHV